MCHGVSTVCQFALGTEWAVVIDKVKGQAPHSYLLQGYTFGFLTVLELTWLLMRQRDEPTTLYISMAFKRSVVDPSVAQALYWLIHQVGTSARAFQGTFQALFSCLYA